KGRFLLPGAEAFEQLAVRCVGESFTRTSQTHTTQDNLDRCGDHGILSTTVLHLDSGSSRVDLSEVVPFLSAVPTASVPDRSRAPAALVMPSVEISRKSA